MNYRIGHRIIALAVVVSASDDPLTFLEMTDYLRSVDLTPQKIPEQLEIVEVLPRNPSGKILKRDLRDRFA